MGDEVEVVLKAALGAALGVISWFLKETAASLKKVREMADDHEVTLGRHDERISTLETWNGNERRGR